MPHQHGSGGRSQKTCRCHVCDEEFTVEEGEDCLEAECPYCHGIAQKSPRGGPGRREEEEKQAAPEEPPKIPGPIPPWFPKPLPVGKKCRCPSCNFERIIEEGARCLNTTCPECGEMMDDA